VSVDLEDLAGRSLGPWTLGAVLGKGAMGAVFAGTNAEGARAAVKVILAGKDAKESLRVRFEREARSISRIQDPHVCACLGHGTDEEAGLQWLALEFIDGRDLSDVLKARGSLTPAEAIGYTRQILLGLKAAHEAGVIHRDLKPANMIVTPDGTLKLVDFGLARREDESLLLTAEGALLGTPHYMAPEQVEGRAVDHRCDLYALGVLIFHVLAGRPPFRGSSLMDILSAHVKKRVPPLRDYCPTAPAALDRFVGRLCRKEAKDRFQSAEAALVALNALDAKRVSRRQREAKPEEGQAKAAQAPNAQPKSRRPQEVENPVFGDSALAVYGIPAVAGVAGGLAAQLVGSLSVGAPISHVAGVVGFLGAWLIVSRWRSRAASEPKVIASGALPGGWSGQFQGSATGVVSQPSPAVAAPAGRPNTGGATALEAPPATGSEEDLEARARRLESVGRVEEAAQALSERAAEVEALRKAERSPKRQARLDAELARLAERGNQLFVGVGRHADAGRLLARAGRHKDAAERYLEAGNWQEASNQFVLAGESARAAELHERAGDVVAAARLKVETLLAKGDKAGAARALERAGDVSQAARYYEESGDLLRAGELYAKDGQHKRAGELLQAAGHGQRAVGLYERAGEHFAAGRAYEELGLLPQALESYERIAAGHADFGQALRRIARLEEKVAAQIEAGEGAPVPPPSEPLSRPAPTTEKSPPKTSGRQRPVHAWLGREIDRYRVSETLGAGAFADVLRAEHVHLERPVALKVLKPEVAARPDVLDRFLAEAKLVSKVRHPGIVEVYDFGQTEGLPWMALELVEGQTLRQILRKRGALGLGEAVRFGRHLADALSAAHQSGVVHRDLKPENVIVDRQGRPHVLDFGLARVFWGTRRDEGAAFLGTPRYASPEAASEGEVTAAADQYALALMVFELASGKLPFQSETAIGWLHHHRETAPALLSSVCKTPRALEEVLAKGLAKAPLERHADLAAFGAALGAALPPRATGPVPGE